MVVVCLVVVLPIPLSFLFAKDFLLCPSRACPLSHFSYIESPRNSLVFADPFYQRAATYIHCSGQLRVYRKFIKPPLTLRVAPLRSALVKVISFRTLDDFTCRHVFVLRPWPTTTNHVIAASFGGRLFFFFFSSQNVFTGEKDRGVGGKSCSVVSVFQIAVKSKHSRCSDVVLFKKLFLLGRDHPLSTAPINPPRCSFSLCLADISRFPRLGAIASPFPPLPRLFPFLPANVDFRIDGSYGRTGSVNPINCEIFLWPIERASHLVPELSWIHAEMPEFARNGSQ